MTLKRIEEGAHKGGAVVVTAFACRTRRDVLLVWWWHHRLKPAVQARVSGFLGVRLYIDWRRRLVRSVSLWTDPAHLYDMGEVREHVAITRLPRRRGIRTSCGVYTFGGDWRTVMFGQEPADVPAPLTADIHFGGTMTNERQ